MTKAKNPADQLRKALVVKEPWISAILDGTKTWELRGSRTSHRGATGLISSGTGLVIGKVEIVGVRGPLLLDELLETYEFHRVPHQHLLERLPYRQTFAWEFAKPLRFGPALPYRHPKGAVVWVDLQKAWA